MDAPSSVVRREARRSLPWFVLALVVLAATLWAVDVAAVRAALGRATPGGFATVVALVAGAALARGIAYGRIFAVLDRPLSVPRAVVVYLAATFSNNVTPSGQAGGVPVAGLFGARASGARYETACAGILSANVAGNVAGICLGLVGAGVLAATTVVGRTLAVAVGTSLALLVLVVALLAGAWVGRDYLGTGAVAVLVALANLVDRLPGVAAPGEAAIADRVSGFGTAAGRVVRAPRRDLAVVVGATLAGHLLVVVALWAAFGTVASPVALAVLLAVVPLANATAVAPLPGGLGGIQAALTGLVVALVPAVDPGVAGAAVLVFRAVTFWLQTLVGGVAAAGIAAGG